MAHDLAVQTVIPMEDNQTRRRNCNNWYFSNQSDICKQVWDIGQAYLTKFKDDKTKPHRHNWFPVQLTKYFYFLYLTGARLNEPFLKPGIELNTGFQDGYSYMQVTRVNEKHFTRQTANREVIAAIMPIFDIYEQQMWNFITDGGNVFNTEQIFKFSEWGNVADDRISRLVKRNFKTNLRDEAGNVHKNAGITPHILRHMRCANLILHRVREELILRWIGWADKRMMYYYAHIKRILDVRNQTQMIKADGIGTNLRLGLSVDVSY